MNGARMLDMLLIPSVVFLGTVAGLVIGIRAAVRRTDTERMVDEIKARFHTTGI
jgi:uncharacterized membrane protein